ncbi:TIGR00255 family protein [Fontimonas thermophila]|uniref:TIGR00255 family protein n=1 Tax=Fontimonas thermophila TaxID=1076937 RepID=A0A1I2K8N1_9GAMM|nr:YicC/YloC family endoribonuclease [Fontimonas thermophila]SFF62699.1 TIGR00255 family protein [Fontimonas thermophila]
MTKSMTGYARVERADEWGRIGWELRAVNHRYLDVQFKMPEEFRIIESELRQLAGARLSRGKVECLLRYQRESMPGERIELDYRRLAQLRQALDTVNAEFGATTAPEPMRVLSFPGVVREERPDLAPLLAQARALFVDALDEFTAFRVSEGRRLAQFLLERCEALLVLVQQIRARHGLVRDQWLARLRARCLELGVEVEPQRLAQEVVLTAQRLDIEEEMSRLVSHIEEVRQALAREDAVGRKLDFLMQELNREANTTASKSQDAEMTRLAVEMKVIIEQMREQVQNIE